VDRVEHLHHVASDAIHDEQAVPRRAYLGACTTTRSPRFTAPIATTKPPLLDYTSESD
jgi:hypothetical protein